MSNKIVTIPNFRLSVFKSLINQTLPLKNDLLFEFKKDFVRSVSNSSTSTLVKFWNIKMSDLLAPPAIETAEDLDNLKAENTLDFEPFDMYYLNGTNFVKFIDAHSSAEFVDLNITVKQKEGGKWEAVSIEITSNQNGDILSTRTELTIETMMSSKTADYDNYFEIAKAAEGDYAISIASEQVQEIKRLVKTLQQSTSNNKPYLNFEVAVVAKELVVKDDTFTKKIALVIDRLPENNFTFNIMKSDFVVMGNHNFVFYIQEKSDSANFMAKYANSIIWCLTVLLDPNNTDSFDSNDLGSFDSLDLDKMMMD